MENVSTLDEGLKYAVAWTKEHCDYSSNRRGLITVAGGTRSGKTFFTDRLAQLLASYSMINLDDLFKDLGDESIPVTTNCRVIFDSPESYHQKEFVDIVKALLQGQSLWIPQYDMATNRRVTNFGRFVYPGRVVIAEGLFAVRFLQSLWTPTLHVFLEAHPQLISHRRIQRDTQEFGIPWETAEDVFWGIVHPHYEEDVKPQRDQADLVVVNNFEEEC